MVNFYCGVVGSQKDQVLGFVDDALHDMPSDVDPSVQVIAFVDRGQGVEVEYRWRKAHGEGGLDYQSIRTSWQGIDGKQLPGAVFLLLEDDMGEDGVSVPLAELVLHEMHHVLQDELQTGSMTLPPWLIEGGAESFAYSQLRELGLVSPFVELRDQPECDYPLAKLAYEDPKVPALCPYFEGERAVTLLVRNFGPDRYYQLFRLAVSGRSLRGVFRRVYGISLEQFYRLFDEYRNSGYTDAPRLGPPASSLILNLPR